MENMLTHGEKTTTFSSASRYISLSASIALLADTKPATGRKRLNSNVRLSCVCGRLFAQCSKFQDSLVFALPGDFIFISVIRVLYIDNDRYFLIS